MPTESAALLALVQLAKDWGGQQTTLRRPAVLSLIVILAVVGAVDTYYSEKKSSAQHGIDQAQITELTSAVKSANDAQDTNTKQFPQSFKDLTQRVSELQTEVKTARLKEEAGKLKKDLEATQPHST